MRLMILAVLSLLCGVAAAASNVAPNSEALAQLPKSRHPAPLLWTAGQPSPEQFAQLKNVGIVRVIDLRPDSETPDFDEATAAQREGLIYRNLPIATADDLTLANVKALDAMLSESGGDATLLHCASSNRVGALMSLRAAWLQGRSADEALAIGRAHGLASLEPIVAQKLAEPQKN